MEAIIKPILIGIGATLTMDVWALILGYFFNIKSLDYSFVGRLLGHFPNGKFTHENIANAKPIRHELAIGWIAHYLIGITFSFLLIGIWGVEWSRSPTILPAIFIGIITIIAPFLIMQPAMGFGIAASQTPNPNIARIKSLFAHFVYGVGLYLSALLLTSL